MTYNVPDSLFNKNRLIGGTYALEMYCQAMRTALSTYRSLLSSGVPESDARLVLPRGYSDSFVDNYHADSARR